MQEKSSLSLNIVLFWVIHMIKLLLCIPIIASSSLVGFSYSNSLYRRKSVLENFSLMIKNCSTKIRYNSGDLFEIFDTESINYSFNTKKPFCEQWCEMLKAYSKILTIEDIKILKDFSENLGTYDVSGELSNISMYIEMLSAQIEIADQQIKEKSKLYKTLGMSFGLAVAILLI